LRRKLYALRFQPSFFLASCLKRGLYTKCFLTLGLLQFRLESRRFLARGFLR
jgi:hypothetical protein